ncbi:MAG: helix-turn-helix domain-containing protein [Candidatus Aenigmatarchaeota archaeon]
MLEPRLKLASDIIGEIVLNENPHLAMKRWRSIFRISQKELAAELKISPSVISDYESGRRKSPGILMIKRYVLGLLDIDRKRGGDVQCSFVQQGPDISTVIIDRKDYERPISIQDFCKKIGAEIVVDKKGFLYGHMIIDSLRAVTQIMYSELAKLPEMSIKKALIFTKLTRGRTPLVALKVAAVKPGLVVLHNISRVDEIAKVIAEVEDIALAICPIEDINILIDRLKEIT